VVEQYCSLVWRILGKFDNLSRTEKEDLSHDVFVILLDKGLRSFRGSTVHEFRAYLKMITVNEAKSYLRRHGRRLEMLDPFLSGEGEEAETRSVGALLPDANPGPEERVAKQEQLQGLLLCVQELPAIDQQIFWMETRGYSYKEMTEMLGIAQGTVASKFYRAKAKIEECLRKAGLL
jgi:RNA polymerase sigma factor (sigma-70 family)